MRYYTILLVLIFSGIFSCKDEACDTNKLSSELFSISSENYSPSGHQNVDNIVQSPCANDHIRRLAASYYISNGDFRSGVNTIRGIESRQRDDDYLQMFGYKGMGMRDSAIEFGFNVLMDEIIHDKSDSLEMYILIAEIYSDVGNFDKALYYYNYAIRSMLNYSPNSKYIMLAHRSVFHCLIQSCRKEEACSYAKEFLSEVKEEYQGCW